MRKASFSVEKPTSHTKAHNTREDAPRYLIGVSDGRENLYEEYYSFENFQELAEARYLEINKQKMQTSQKEALFEEALISLEEHHTKDDVIKLFKALNKKYTGHTLINLAIHNDEGHFVKDGIEYYPTKHIIQKEDSWYILDENDTHILEGLKDKDFKPKDEDFKIKVNINEFEKVYNYHAHAVFSRFDLETGKSARFQKGTMSERYKFVAEQMKMRYAPDENRLVKKSIGQHKADLSATRNAKLVMKKELELKHTEELQATKEQLKDANNQLRTFMKENGALRTDYAELEKAKKELEEKLKAKDLTEKELLEKFQELEKNFKKEKGHLTSLIEVKEIDNLDLKNQNKSLQEQKEVLEEKVIALEQKTASSSNMSDLEVKAELQNIVNEEIEVKNVKTGVFSTEKAPVIKDSKSFFKRVQDLASRGTQGVMNTIENLKREITQLKSFVKSLQTENANLKAKVRELESEAPKQIEVLKPEFQKIVEQAKEINENKKPIEKFKEIQKEVIEKQEVQEKKRGVSRAR